MGGDALGETLTRVFLGLFVFEGLLFSGLSIPLARRRVKPNRWYGLRTHKTLSNEQIWYEANAYAGRGFFRAGIVGIVAAIVLFFVLRTNFVLYAIAGVLVQLSTVILSSWLSLRYLRSL